MLEALPSELKTDIEFAKKPKHKHKYLQKSLRGYCLSIF